MLDLENRVATWEARVEQASAEFDQMMDDMAKEFYYDKQSEGLSDL